jgi:flagellar basal body-associated protein FliL
MFEPLGETENEKSTGSRRSMRVIWIVIAVAAVVLAVLSFR